MKFIKHGKFMFPISMILLIVICTFTMTSCSSNLNNMIVIGEPTWESVQIHNQIASIIIENGYGYKTDITTGSSPAVFTALRKGQVDVHMEIWTENFLEAYDEAIKNGEIIEVSTNFDDNAQGLYIPAYIVKGDPERGIEPVASDLKTVKDLKKYWEIFKDEEDPSKGRIYGSPAGYYADEVLQGQMKTYGLDEMYNYFSPGSDSGLVSSLAAAYTKGEPWVGYSWDPTWIMAKYDMMLLEDEKYSDEKWDNGFACEWPSQKVTVGVSKDLENKAPEVVGFLKNYKTSCDLTNEALLYMQENNASAKDTAIWFMKEHEDLWSEWVTDEAENKVKTWLNKN